MTRPPFTAHLCAQYPAAFERGFGCASFWVDHLAHAPDLTPQRIHHAIHHSTGVPFPVTAAVVGLAPEPAVEGFMLGVYGYVRWLSESHRSRNLHPR